MRGCVLAVKGEVAQLPLIVVNAVLKKYMT
jgi:hypothetical protein